MKNPCREKIYSNSSSAQIRIVLLLTFLSLPAFASLGGDLSSVESDRMKIAPSSTTSAVQHDSCSVQEITEASGTVVREYLTPAGRVFGVAWQGPFTPDMHQILGAYFDRYSSAANEARSGYLGHRPLDIREPNLVVQSAGHMRAFSGRAYDPTLLPEGVSPNDVR